MKKILFLMAALLAVFVTTALALDKASPKPAASPPVLEKKNGFQVNIKPAITVDYRQLYENVMTGRDGAPRELVITTPPYQAGIMTVTRFAVLTIPEPMTTEAVRQQITLVGLYPADQLQGIIYARSQLALDDAAVALDGLVVSDDKDQILGVRYASVPTMLIKADMLGADALVGGKWPAGTKFLGVRRY